MKESSAREIISKYRLVESNIFLFKKIYKNKMVYYSELSQKDLKTESHFVSYNEYNVNQLKIKFRYCAQLYTYYKLWLF